MHKSKLFTLVAAGAAAFSTPMLMAQQAPSELPGQPDAARVTSGTYKVDPNHTLVGWRVDHLGFNDYFGIFGDVTGTLELDKDNPDQSKVDLTIPITSVSVVSAGLKDHLLRPGKDGAEPDFFGPEPEAARFVSTSVVPMDDGKTAIINGALTLNGVTKPVALRMTFTGAGTSPYGPETVGFEGNAVITRSDFGVNGALPLVSDKVELTLTAAFEKQ